MGPNFLDLGSLSELVSSFCWVQISVGGAAVPVHASRPVIKPLATLPYSLSSPLPQVPWCLSSLSLSFFIASSSTALLAFSLIEVRSCFLPFILNAEQ